MFFCALWCSYVYFDVPKASVPNTQQSSVLRRASTPRQPKPIPRPRIKEQQRIFENKWAIKILISVYYAYS